MKDIGCTTFKVYPIGFSSTTIKRVCRATLQTEAYSLQAGMESGDRIQALIAEMRGEIRNLVAWLDISRKTVPHLQMSDCRSLTEHLSIAVPTRVQDKRLAIELSAMHQSYFEEDRVTWDLYESRGDRLEWIATRTMVADCLTKVDETDFPAEGTERECAGCSYSAMSRYLITCIAWLLMFSLESFPFTAGIACIFELFGLNRALEHWAKAQRKKRDRVCQTTTKFICVFLPPQHSHCEHTEPLCKCLYL